MKRPIASQGNPLDYKEIYETLFVFMDDVLFLFKPFSVNTIGNPITGEDDITQDLEKILNDHARKNNQSFAFQNRHKKGKYSTDISVYKLNTYYEDFCWIEAKRLPTPNAEKNRDEREYVFVSQEKENGKKKFKGNGGIQRFKEGKHAPELDFSIMIGYIQEYDTNHWLSKINGWITELANAENGFWSITDCLKKYDSNKCDRFVSIHKRKDIEKPITLHHYLIKL